MKPDIAPQGFADDVFEGAYNITTDAQKGLGIFDDLSVILNVDVNVTGMNTDVQVSSSRLVHRYSTTSIVTTDHSVSFKHWYCTGKQAGASSTSCNMRLHQWVCNQSNCTSQTAPVNLHQ